MNCDRAHQLIHALLDREVAPIDRAGLDLHLDSCGPCRALLDQYRRMEDGFEWLADQSEAVILLDEIRTHRELPKRHVIRFPLSRWVAGALAAAAAIAALILNFAEKPSSVPSQIATNSQLPVERPVDPPAAPIQFELVGESDDIFLALPQSTTNPRVHIVWLYAAQPQVGPASELPVPTDGPQHS